MPEPLAASNRTRQYRNRIRWAMLHRRAGVSGPINRRERGHGQQTIPFCLPRVHRLRNHERRYSQRDPWWSGMWMLIRPDRPIPVRQRQLPRRQHNLRLNRRTSLELNRRHNRRTNQLGQRHPQWGQDSLTEQIRGAWNFPQHTGKELSYEAKRRISLDLFRPEQKSI